MTPARRIAHRLALGLRGDTAGLAELDRRQAEALAELDRRISEVRAERDRWAALRQAHDEIRGGLR